MRLDELATASPADRAVAGKIEAAARTILSAEAVDAATGAVDLAALFLNMAVLSTWPRSEAVWKRCKRIGGPNADLAMRAGLCALIADPALPNEQHQAAQAVLDFHTWRLWEDRRHDHDDRKARWPTGPDAPAWSPDWAALDCPAVRPALDPTRTLGRSASRQTKTPAAYATGVVC